MFPRVFHLHSSGLPGPQDVGRGSDVWLCSFYPWKFGAELWFQGSSHTWLLICFVGSFSGSTGLSFSFLNFWADCVFCSVMKGARDPLFNSNI